MNAVATPAMDPLSVLQRVFGFSSFRPNQEQLVMGILEHRDVFGVMPTGGGKSLCYQLPAIILPGCAVVVSPLIALMKDQVDNARAVGIRAACITSHATLAEKQEVARAYRQDELDLLYVAPERLSQPAFSDFLRQCPRQQPSFFAVDEAHCISEWGHDFRPDYLFLNQLKTLFPGVPCAAFTATATPQVADDIQGRLSLNNPVCIRASFDRTNLFYEVRSRTDGDQQLIEFIRDQPDAASGIVYRTSRKSVEQTAELLRANGIAAQAYHAGLEAGIRSQIQEDYIRDRYQVIVATVAFGMGIDKPDVRFVVHYDLPKTIEGYYQETGRAGRDGDPSRCLLLYSPGDVGKIGYLIDQAESEEERQRNWTLVRHMDRYAASTQCRRISLLAYFGERYEKEKCGACDACEGHFKEVDATYEARVALSAIARTGGRFGAGYLTEIITGAKTERIREFGHDQLKTYGLGRKKPRPYWRRIYDALLAESYLQLSQSQYPVPQMTATGRALMKGESTFALREDTRIEPSKARRGTVSDENLEYDQGIFEVLRRLRIKMAEEEGVPPYVVFSDRTLRQIAAYQPANETEFGALHGIGKAKVERYAARFLLELQEYLGEHPALREQALPSPVAPDPQRTVKVKKPAGASVNETVALFRSGLTVAQIASQRGYTESTIVTHLGKAALDGEQIDLMQFISADKADRARALLLEHGTVALKPAFEAGGGEVSYGDLRLMELVLQIEEREAQ